LPFRQVFDGILYVLRTGCQWKALPKEYGSGSTCHRRFQQWVKEGAFERVWVRLLEEYDDIRGIMWRWQSLNSGTVKSPLGGRRLVPILQSVQARDEEAHPHGQEMDTPIRCDHVSEHARHEGGVRDSRRYRGEETSSEALSQTASMPGQRIRLPGDREGRHRQRLHPSHAPQRRAGGSREAIQPKRWVVKRSAS
jgi:transposase